MLCSVLPDLDVIAFAFGIRYGDFWGHRGFSHSLVFALLLALVVTRIYFKEAGAFSAAWLALSSFFFVCTASHGLLDAMTSGGLGVAFFSPFDNTRHFFPWRPIQVSPIGITQFFSEWGLRVILSEMLWVWLPGLVLIILVEFLRRSIKSFRFREDF